MPRGLSLLLFGLVAACGEPQPARAPLRVWHTFGPEETEALNADLARIAPGGVQATVVPFGRAHNRIREVLGRGGADCPDLIRIDATWLPGLVQAGLLMEAAVVGGDWLPSAKELTVWRGRHWGLPQTVDGLVLIANAQRVAGEQPPESVDELVALARRLTAGGKWGLSIRSDGYWFVPWLRAAGGELLDPSTEAIGVEGETAERALAAYVALSAPGGVAPAPSSAGDEAAEEARRFASGDVAIVIGGPWTLAALARAGVPADDVVLWPFPRASDGRPAAPQGGHVWAVPACSRRQHDAWQLALALSTPEVQGAWSARLGTIPTRPAALAAASPRVRQLAQALEQTRPLPRHPATPLLFDDLTPAVQAAMSGDATPAEALAGVARAWHRILAALPPADRPALRGAGGTR